MDFLEEIMHGFYQSMIYKIKNCLFLLLYTLFLKYLIYLIHILFNLKHTITLSSLDNNFVTSAIFLRNLQTTCTAVDGEGLITFEQFIFLEKISRKNKLHTLQDLKESFSEQGLLQIEVSRYY